MSYLANIAFSLELIALAIGFWILNLSKSKEAHCPKSTKIIGFVIVIGSLANMTCTLANTVKDYMTEDSPFQRRGQRMERMMNNNQGMPGNMMMQNNQQMMQQPMQQMPPMQNNQQMMQQPPMQNNQMPMMPNGQMPMQNGQMPPPNGQMGNPGGQPPPPPQN